MGLVVARTPINVLFCCDPGYAQHLCVALVSLLENNRNSVFDILVVSREGFGDNARKVERSVGRYANVRLRFKLFTLPTRLTLPVRAHYSLDIYSRLWLTDFFGDEVDRVLYLDSDLIVVGDISELWDTDLQGNLLAATSIPGSTKCAGLNIPECYGYFNSGVLLADLRQWRETEAISRVISYIAAHPANLVDPDQDVLNACFFDRRAHLPYIWNVISPFYFEYHPLGLTPGEVERIRSDGRIIHFNGASKPWSYMSKHPRRDDYLKYLSMTEWRDFTPPDRTLPNVAKKQLSNLLPSWVARALRS